MGAAAASRSGGLAATRRRARGSRPQAGPRASSPLRLSEASPSAPGQPWAAAEPRAGAGAAPGPSPRPPATNFISRRGGGRVGRRRGLVCSVLRWHGVPPPGPDRRSTAGADGFRAATLRSLLRSGPAARSQLSSPPVPRSAAFLAPVTPWPGSETLRRVPATSAVCAGVPGARPRGSFASGRIQRLEKRPRRPLPLLTPPCAGRRLWSGAGAGVRGVRSRTLAFSLIRLNKTNQPRVHGRLRTPRPH